METSHHPGHAASRLRPPRMARGVVARPRFDGLLDLVRGRTLTVVKAPPGYGKTTVGQSWAAALGSSGARVAWLSLNAHDDDCERFFSALAAALRRAGGEQPNPGGDEGWGASELSIPLAHRLEWLVLELAADPSELYVFLDDYHELKQPEIHRALADELRRAPEHVHVVLLTRTAPPIDLACLRAHDAVLEIDGPTLCFDFAETQALLAKAQAVPPDPHDTAALHELTGGWPAALRAAMLNSRIQGSGVQPPPRRLPGTLRSINALFGELLESLPADLREFLERTSVAERLCASLATRVSGRGDAQALLEQLERQQFFIDPLDDRQQWFAFHPLFRDFLMRSAQQADPALVAATRRAAAQWSAEQRLWTDAIEQALAAGDTELALGWIEGHAMSVVGAGDLMTLLAWERQLRSHLVESPLRLRLAFAWALGLAMACDKALVLLDGVEAQLEQTPAAPGHEALRVECLALRAVLVCTTGDHELAASLAAQCEHRCAGDVPRPQWVASALRNVAAATSLHHGRWDQLFGVGQAPADVRAAPEGDPMARVYRLSIRGLAEMRQGNLDDAAALLEEAMAVGAVAKPLAALPAPTLALVRYFQDQVTVAGRINAEHIDVNKRVAPIEALYAAYLVAARVARHDGQSIRARQLVDEGLAIAAARRWRRAETVLLLEKVRLCLLDGRNAEAHACCGQTEALASGARSLLDRTDFGRAAVLTRAWCDLADGRAERAVLALGPLAAAARDDRRIVDAIVMLGSLGLAQLAAGSTPAACATLREAAALVRETGAVRALLDQPTSLTPLVAATLLSRTETAAHPWLAPLLSRWQRSGETTPGASTRAAAGSLGSLSPREHHILGLLSDGQSNKQIARGLGIAPETVKTHVSKIFTKLGAQNRAQAAAMLSQE